MADHKGWLLDINKYQLQDRQSALGLAEKKQTAKIIIQ